MPKTTDADLHRLMDDLPAMVAAVDCHGRSAYRNHACRTFFGLGADGENGDENWISDLVRGADPVIKSRIDGGSGVRIVRELAGIDGRRRFDVSLIPSVSPSGDVRGYVALARDADGDDTAAETDDGVAALLESLPDGALLFDAQGRLCHANSRFDVVWPTSEHRFEIGARLDRTLRVVTRYASREPRHAGQTDDLAERIARQGDAVTAIELDVAGRSMLCRVTGTAAGGTLLTFSVVERPLDGERTRNEMTDELLDAAASQMPGLISQIDGEGRYIFANPAYSDWYGVSLDRIIGGTDEELMAEVPQWFADETSLRQRRADIRMALSGQTVGFEKLRKYPDGRDRHIRGALIPSFDGDGRVRGVSILTIDISEEKRRERELSESEERYRSLVELSPSYIMVHRAGECLFANPATHELYGFESGDSLIGRRMLELVHPDDRAEIIDRNRALTSGEGPSDRLEVRIQRVDGTEFHVENRVAAIQWDGEPAVLVVGTDISDRKRAEQRIRDRETIFRGLVDASFDAVIISDQGTIIDFNSKAVELFGYDASELSGLEVLALVPDDKHEFVARQIELEVSVPYDSISRTKDGRTFPGEISARTFIRNGRRIRVAAIRDLTQRNQAADALRESEELLRLVVDNLPALVSYIGADGRYMLANAGYETMFGLPRDQIVGRHFEEFVNGPADDELAAGWRESRRANIARALSGEMVEAERERTFADGQARQLKGTLVPHLGADGEVLGICVLIQDVSEQKRIEQALRLSEHRFRDFAEASGDWFWETDLDQRFTYVSRRGDPGPLLPRDLEMVGKSRMRIHAEFGADRTVVLRIQERMDRAEPFRNVEVCLTIPGAGDRWLQLSGQPVSDETDKITGYRGIAINITERKRAEVALRQSEAELARTQARLIDAIESLPLAFNLYDADERLVMSNSLMHKHYPNYAHLIVPGAKFEDIIEFAAQRQPGDIDKKQWKQERLERFRSSDGSEHELIVDGKWSHVSYRKTSEGGTVGIRFDITARKRAEEALRESEERYRRLAQLLPDAVRVVTGDKVVFANTAAATLLGADSPEQIMGLHAQIFLDLADRDVILDRMARVNHGEYVPWREHWLRALGGNLVPVESAIAPIAWDGTPSRLVVNRDMSRHKRVENQLRQAMEEAKQANVAKSRFLAAASHDLRQPIQALGLLNAALAYELHDPSLTEITANMSHAIDAMKSVLDGLLDISKLEAGVVTPEFGAFAIAPLIERVAGELSFEANAKGLDLRVVATSANVRSDRDLLERIIQNFVTNAIRYTQSGRILIGCRRRGENVHLQVWDTGRGIGADQRERIFEEFYQIEIPARDRSKGLGLGLAIVDRLARLLGHSVEVRSEPGRGSMFSVVLPIDDSVGAAAEDIDPLPRVALDGKRILILDDDKDVVRATTALLSRWGAEVVGAHSADDALRLATEGDHRPDLVIVDYVLSDGETGTDVIRRLDEALGASIPRIVISGDVSTRIESEVRRVDSVLLHKPVNPAKLRSLIHHLVISGG